MDSEPDPAVVERAEVTFTIEMATAYDTVKRMYDQRVITWERLVDLLKGFYFVGYGEGIIVTGEKAAELNKKKYKRNRSER